MNDRNLTRNYNLSPARKRRVWFPGSTLVRKGMGLCYDAGIYGSGTNQAVTDKWGRRLNSTVVPSTTYNRRFAGVATQNYPALSTGQLIDIYEPGGVADIAVGVATAIVAEPADGTILTCSASSADAGRFTLQGLPGRGTAMALQTLAEADGGDIADHAFDGSASTSYSGGVTTISCTGIGTACGYGDDDIAATDFIVVILGGSTTANGTVPVTTGAYAVATAPSADTITVASNIATAASVVALYVIKNSYPTVMAYLFDGEESGLQEVVSPDSATGITPMTGGTTFVAGGFTLAGNTTYTLADAATEGLKKAFCGLGAIGTSDFAITVTSGVEADNTVLNAVAIDGAGEHITLEWQGGYGGQSAGHWRELSSAGATKS